MGVSNQNLTLSLMSTWALAAISSFTTRLWPFSLALCNAVHPSCIQTTNEYLRDITYNTSSAIVTFCWILIWALAAVNNSTTLKWSFWAAAYSAVAPSYTAPRRLMSRWTYMYKNTSSKRHSQLFADQHWLQHWLRGQHICGGLWNWLKRQETVSTVHAWHRT